MRRLILVRHGESEWNVERRIQGQSGTGLSERGHEQAKHTAAFLAEAFPDAVLLSSDLQRCLETLEPIADALGAEPTHDVGLRERDFGRWTGMLVTEVADSDPAVWDRWRRGEDVVAEVGGEGTDAFTARVLATLRRIIAGAPAHSTTICVTHGGPVWHGTRALLGLGTEVLGGVANAGITEFAIDDPAAPRLQAWNQTAHLPPELHTWRRASDVGNRADRDGDGTSDAPPVGT